MPDDKKPDPKADDEELTPAEEKRFGKNLKFLEEDDTPSGAPTHTPTPTPHNSTPTTGGTFDIEGAVNRALDAREKGKAKDDEVGKLRADVDALKPKAKKWYDPFTMFSGVL